VVMRCGAGDAGSAVVIDSARSVMIGAARIVRSRTNDAAPSSSDHAKFRSRSRVW
jgi:hypothetical protein